MSQTRQTGLLALTDWSVVWSRWSSGCPTPSRSFTSSTRRFLACCSESLRRRRRRRKTALVIQSVLMWIMWCLRADSVSLHVCGYIPAVLELRLSSVRSASEEAMTVLEEVLMFTFQQCVYYLTKVRPSACLNRGFIQEGSFCHQLFKSSGTDFFQF